MDDRNPTSSPAHEFVPNRRRAYLLNDDGEFVPSVGNDPQSIPTEIWEEPEAGDH